MEITSYGKNHFFAYPINDSIAVRRNNNWVRFSFSFGMILLSFVFFKSGVVLMGFKSLAE